MNPSPPIFVRDPRLATLIFSVWLASVTTVSAQTNGGAELYAQRIKPLLSARCYACHGALKQEGSLRLDTVVAMRKGGDNGSVVQPNDSVLLDRVTAPEGERMPPEGAALTAEEIGWLTSWITNGAAAPADETPEQAPDEHWAFQTPVASPGAAEGHPIDAILAAQRGDAPVAAPIDRRRLLRRVYLDLIGIPPTLEQQQAFLDDERPDAYERVVDELLNSPHHGERWARHWMDIWRYTDWYGLGAQLRNSQKHIWHWRDWIIESLNNDRGYDEMLRLMLAADELRPEDLDATRATGFLARNYYLFNRTTWLDSTIEHTSKAFLGLTLNCAKCHDHKYDPLTQEEYYRFRAIFEPHQVRLDPVAGQLNLEADGLPRVFDAHPEMPTYLHIRGDEKQLDDQQLAPGVPAILGGDYNPSPISLPLAAYRPELREDVKGTRLANAQAALKTADSKIAAAQKQLEGIRSQNVQSPLSGPVLWSDSFNDIQSERWNRKGTWKIEDGQAVQLATGAERRSLQSVANHPADFVATMKFTTIGGDQWRSVGIAFDVEGDHEKLVYMSAVQPGSKVQVSYRTPQQVYPAEGKVDRAVKLNEPYELSILVQGKRIHVYVDGKFTLAYELPIPRSAGRLELIAFDAQVKIDELTLRALPEGMILNAAPAGMTAESAARALAEAEGERRTAAARFAFLTAAYAATELAAANADAAKAKEQAALTRQAALAQRELELRQAEEQELKALHAKEAGKANDKDLAKKLADAQAAVNKAQAAMKTPGEQFTLDSVSLKALEGPAEKDASRRAPFPKVSTGRRSALARWISDRNHPLTARVAVNHIWTRHLGQPLVESVTDFGRRADPPRQQELLDHLAVDLMDNQWSMKRLHRLIVTSAAYRRGSSVNDAILAADPDNQLYTRRRPLRMESEVLRDSLLTLAGALDRRLGGPTVDPSDKITFRRSLYFTHSRDARHKFLSMFDHADILRCYRRQESIVPQQALALANSSLALEMSRRIAARLHQAFPKESDFVPAVFRTVLCADPTERELAICQEMLVATREAIPTTVTDPAKREMRVRENFVHAIINHNDFLSIR